MRERRVGKGRRGGSRGCTDCCGRRRRSGLPLLRRHHVGHLREERDVTGRNTRDEVPFAPVLRGLVGSVRPRDVLDAYFAVLVENRPLLCALWRRRREAFCHRIRLP